jgi:tRNA-splicing ligase RtcB
MKKLSQRLLTWASVIDDVTVEQALTSASMPFIYPHLALMPDAHLGKGATVGSVIPTLGAIIPAAVGVDIGCGMIAAELDVTEDQLPDSLDLMLSRVEQAIPAGVGRGHDKAAPNASKWLAANLPSTHL